MQIMRPLMFVSMHTGMWGTQGMGTSTVAAMRTKMGTMISCRIGSKVGMEVDMAVGAHMHAEMSARRANLPSGMRASMRSNMGMHTITNTITTCMTTTRTERLAVTIMRTDIITGMCVITISTRREVVAGAAARP